MSEESQYVRIHEQEKIDQNGEVFTPTPLVNEMLDKLPDKLFKDKTKTFLDNSCGNGQFLFEVLKRKMEAGASHKEALSTIYGVDIDQKNVDECTERLLMGKNGELKLIVNTHIICADALDPNHPGWIPVGYMWEPSPNLLNIDTSYKPTNKNEVEEAKKRATAKNGSETGNEEYWKLFL